MQNKVKLITGVCGEVGRALIKQFKNDEVISLDLDSFNSHYKKHQHFIGSILDNNLLNEINHNYQITEIYHLAAVLSTKAEKNSLLANQVNIDGTSNLYALCLSQIKKYNKKISFFFPSSIAVYNVPNINKNELINETTHFVKPQTVYGKTKIFSEQQGKDYANLHNHFDFRCIRFPGIISSETMPTGGTSDYASEMLHSAMKGKDYICFVNSKTTLPFIVMPDAILAIVNLMQTPRKKLTSYNYNITSFSPNVLEIKKKINEFSSKFNIDFNIDSNRQKIVNTWPRYIDDSLARNNWGWKPKYNFEDAFKHYLIPNLYKKYKITEVS